MEASRNDHANEMVVTRNGQVTVQETRRRYRHFGLLTTEMTANLIYRLRICPVNRKTRKRSNHETDFTTPLWVISVLKRRKRTVRDLYSYFFGQHENYFPPIDRSQIAGTTRIRRNHPNQRWLGRSHMEHDIYGSTHPTKVLYCHGFTPLVIG